MSFVHPLHPGPGEKHTIIPSLHSVKTKPSKYTIEIISTATILFSLLITIPLVLITKSQGQPYPFYMPYLQSASILLACWNGCVRALERAGKEKIEEGSRQFEEALRSTDWKMSFEGNVREKVGGDMV